MEHFREIFSGDIEKIVNYFLREQRRVFVKHRTTDAKIYRPDLTKDGEEQAHSIHLALLGINRWGVYEAYKMLRLKQAWFKVVENKNNKPAPDENYINYDENGKESESEDEEKDDEKVKDKESEKEESGKDDDEEEKSEENEDSDEEKESEEEEDSEVEESEEEDEESEDESEDDDDDEKESGEETDGENKKDKKPQAKPKPSEASKAGPSDRKK